jgi:hypothetical protein
MLGSHIIKSVGVLFFRADKTVSINLTPEFLEQMNQTDDKAIYQLVRSKVDCYVQSSSRFANDNRSARAKYITMAIFAHYLKNHPERNALRSVLKDNSA